MRNVINSLIFCLITLFTSFGVMAHGTHLVAKTSVLLHSPLYTSDAADEEDNVDLGGLRIIKKKNTDTHEQITVNI